MSGKTMKSSQKKNRLKPGRFFTRQTPVLAMRAQHLSLCSTSQATWSNSWMAAIRTVSVAYCACKREKTGCSLSPESQAEKPIRLGQKCHLAFARVSQLVIHLFVDPRPVAWVYCQKILLLGMASEKISKFWCWEAVVKRFDLEKYEKSQTSFFATGDSGTCGNLVKFYCNILRKLRVPSSTQLIKSKAHVRSSLLSHGVQAG